MQELDQERRRLEIAIEREREERERLDEIERKNRQDKEIANNRSILSTY